MPAGLQHSMCGENSRRADLAVGGRLDLELFDGLPLRVCALARVMVDGYLRLGYRRAASTWTEQQLGCRWLVTAGFPALQVAQVTSALAFAERMVPSSVGDSARFCSHQCLFRIAREATFFLWDHPRRFPSCSIASTMTAVAGQTCLLFQS